MWKPIPGRFKDYIAMPKQNMYQSIHTTLIADNGSPFEVQIRTWDMHRIAEYGIAAHWRYKEGRSADADFDKKIEWLRQMLEWQKEMGDAREFVSAVKGDLLINISISFLPVAISMNCLLAQYHWILPTVFILRSAINAWELKLITA